MIAVVFLGGYGILSYPCTPLMLYVDIMGA